MPPQLNSPLDCVFHTLSCDRQRDRPAGRGTDRTPLTGRGEERRDTSPGRHDGTGRDTTGRHDKTIELRLTHREVFSLFLSFALSLSLSLSFSSSLLSTAQSTRRPLTNCTECCHVCDGSSLLTLLLSGENFPLRLQLIQELYYGFCINSKTKDS